MATTKMAPGQSVEAFELSTRIDSIIGKLPADFPWKDVVTNLLKDRQNSIYYTHSSIISLRWHEVSEILDIYLPKSETDPWVKEIKKIMLKEIAEVIQ